MKIETVGLVGFGRFGRLVYQHLAPHLTLKVYDREIGRLEGLNEAADLPSTVDSQLIILSVPISSIREACRQIAPGLRPGQVVLDTCSVKIKPLEWMLDILPEETGIVGTHPLFGPDSAKEGIGGLKVAVCPVRVKGEIYRQIVTFLRSLQLVVIETTAQEHDLQIARSQAIFHLIAQALKGLDWGNQAISTPGPEQFGRLIETVQRDTEQLFLDMTRENPFAEQYRKLFIEEILRLDRKIRSQSEGH